MKKILSMALALVMMMAVMVPAFAVELNKDTKNGDVIINTSTLKDTDDDGIGDTDAEEYTVTIPADTTIPWGQETTDVSYSVEAHLKRDGRVNVAVSGTGVMKTVDDVYEIPYTLAGDGVDFKADVPTIYEVGTGAVEMPVAVEISADDWNTAVVEEYNDILTYTAEIVRV